MIKNKNKIRRISSLVMFLVAGVLLLQATAVLAGFGISNPYLNNDQLLRGTTYEENVTFSYDGIGGNLKAVIEIDVPGANGWISVDKGKEFPLVSGNRSVPLKFKVDVPNNAEFKEYKGKINIKVMPVDVLGGNIALAFGGEMAVNLKVVDKKILDFKVFSFRFLDSREGEKVSALLLLSNLGNVDGVPSKMVLDVYDYDKTKVVASKENLPIKEPIKAFGEKEVQVDFDITDLPAGVYWGKLKVFNDDKLIGQYEASLGVMPSTGIKGGETGVTKGMNSLLSAIGLGAINPILAVVIIVVIAVILIALLLKATKKGKKAKK